MAFSLIPREEKFFVDLRAMAEHLCKGAMLLEEMLAPDKPDLSKSEAIEDIEHRCDTLTREIIQRLNRTFVTPIDREDIHALAGALDDVMDAIDACASVLMMYRIDSVRPGARDLASIIRRSTEQIRGAFEALEKRDGVIDCVMTINRLEHQADGVHRGAVIRLFEDESNPIAVMKWKEVLDFLEAATDRCEDVANLLEGVVVKHL